MKAGRMNFKDTHVGVRPSEKLITPLKIYKVHCIFHQGSVTGHKVHMDQIVTPDSDPLDEIDDILQIMQVTPCDYRLDDGVKTKGNETFNALHGDIEM